MTRDSSTLQIGTNQSNVINTKFLMQSTPSGINSTPFLLLGRLFNSFLIRLPTSNIQPKTWLSFFQ